ncbi:SIMPL domain-containing protein [Sinomicrobium weinanense]|uniref:SIMPL domain-containing protein n=1 Tax=Sinomicrobium weinanense TaxID=2842200 RepID=A0A926JQ17_9FLAO|nr:SIMPL domain-containing protein [Sinomicrobium weinanense]MBC9795343.1 SIMPL domain-containing protein [Sinomicrobium weinanense]MBU3122942.1 SIMPL domain-containing protein [Sinomicrobium weinanense]
MKKIILTLVLGSTMALQAQNPSVLVKDQSRTISVSGEGTVKVIPDNVTLKVRVENEGKSAGEVKKLNDVLIDKVLKFCKEMKIDSKDVRTEYLNLNKNYDYQTKEYKYVANQSLSIRLKDLSKYEALTQGLLDAGINRIDGVTFGASNIEELQSKARIKAVENARKKAEEYATALGKSVGDPIYLSETGLSEPIPMPRFATMKVEADASGGRESIAIGEMSIEATVNVGFELK